MFVGGRFDADGDRQFDAVLVVRLRVDPRQPQVRIDGGRFVQQQADLLVVTAIHHHYLILVVLLAQQQRQRMFDEIIGIFAGYDDYRYGRRYRLRVDSPVVAVAGKPAVNAEVIVKLDDQQQQNRSQQAQCQPGIDDSVVNQLIVVYLEKTHAIKGNFTQNYMISDKPQKRTGTFSRLIGKNIYLCIARGRTCSVLHGCLRPGDDPHGIPVATYRLPQRRTRRGALYRPR